MRVAALAVVAAAVAASACGGSDAASVEPTRSTVLAYVWDGQPLLTRLDAVTLEAHGRAVALGKPPISTWVRSPGGGRLAFGAGDAARVGLVDVGQMRRLSTFALGSRGSVAALAWPTSGRVVVALSGSSTEIVVLEAGRGRVVRRERLRGIVTRAVRFERGLVLLLSPPDTIGHATLAVATATAVRTKTLPLDAGVDPPAVLEPGLAVSPNGDRALVVPAGARVVEVDLRTLAVAERELSEPVSLLGRLRSWLEPAAHAKGPLDGPARAAVWLAGNHIVVSGRNYRPTSARTTASEAAGVQLIDARNWSVRTLAADASAAVVAAQTVLAFAGSHAASGPAGIGLRGFGADGHGRFHLFGNRYVSAVSAVGRYAYVAEQSETQTRIDVVDVLAGRLVGTVRKPSFVEVLAVD